MRNESVRSASCSRSQNVVTIRLECASPQKAETVLREVSRSIREVVSTGVALSVVATEAAP